MSLAHKVVSDVERSYFRTDPSGSAPRTHGTVVAVRDGRRGEGRESDQARREAGKVKCKRLLVAHLSTAQAQFKQSENNPLKVQKTFS